MSQNLPKRSLRHFQSLRHPNHLVLAGTNNRNVIITYRLLAAPVQANRDFFLAYWQYISTVSTFLNIYTRVARLPTRDFAFWAKSLRGQLNQGQNWTTTYRFIRGAATYLTTMSLSRTSIICCNLLTGIDLKSARTNMQACGITACAISH